MRRTAIITGAGSGIGRAVAVLLSRQGFDVGLAGRRRESLEETASQCEGAVWTQATDVAQPDSVAELFAKARASWPRLDLLFNNAGNNIPARPLPELSPQDIASVIGSNLLGALFCAREAFAIMSTQSPPGGRIINNGSIAAQAPRPDSAAYTAAKHGVTGLTKSLILDGWRHGISCCQIDIGNAATARTARMAAGVMQPNGTIAVEPRLSVDIVAQQIVDIARLPPEAVVPFLTIMPLGTPLFGRG